MDHSFYLINVDFSILHAERVALLVVVAIDVDPVPFDGGAGVLRDIGPKSFDIYPAPERDNTGVYCNGSPLLRCSTRGCGASCPFSITTDTSAVEGKSEAAERSFSLL